MSSDEYTPTERAMQSKQADARDPSMGTAQQVSLEKMRKMGVCGNPEAAQEYDSDPHILQSLRNNITMYVEAIGAHPELIPDLKELETQYQNFLIAMGGEQ